MLLKPRIQNAAMTFRIRLALAASRQMPRHAVAYKKHLTPAHPRRSRDVLNSHWPPLTVLLFSPLCCVLFLCIESFVFFWIDA